MRMVDVIIDKRDGRELTKDQIEFWINGIVNEEIPDYQTSALLMAICWRGMTARETADLTTAMTFSGETVDLSAIAGIKVDKHSTGGVGDTTTLIVAPVVSACGIPVAKMSGRGLGHTGGTLDKLESIPGVNIERSVAEMIEMVQRDGIAVIGQSGDLDPADRILYALRDVTGTVDAMPLIASSIMSKKLAAGSDAIVLDVKTGSGAFMQTTDDAFALGEEMVAIGEQLQRRTVAIVTDMNQPLGMKIGNALEVQEAIEALSGQIPADDPLMAVSELLAAQMLILGGAAKDAKEAGALFHQAIADGSAREKLRLMIDNLGGDGTIVEHPEDLVHVAAKIDVKSKKDGWVDSMDALEIGRAAQILGAGRAKKDDAIDPDVGIVMKKRVGDAVAQGETLCTLYVNDSKKVEEVETILLNALEISKVEKKRPPMVYGMVSAHGVEHFE